MLLWLLGSSGPLFGQAQVYLMDKAFFLVSRLVGFLADGNVSANNLYAAARSTGGSGWDGFLAAVWGDDAELVAAGSMIGAVV